MEHSNRLQLAINDIKRNVWKSLINDRKRKPSLSETVQDIYRGLTDHDIILTWVVSAMDFSVREHPAQQVFTGEIIFEFCDINDPESHICSNWYITGVGDTQKEAYRDAIHGAKELFLLYFFDVPQKNLDPEKIIRAEYEEKQAERAELLREVLDKMHTKIVQATLADQSTRKKIDEVVMQYVRVNGRPSTSYYDCQTLEAAEAMSAAIDKLLAK